MTQQTLAHATGPHLGSLVRLGKPKVVSMIVFTAIIGMLLATPGLPSPTLLACASLGIWLVASSAAAVNCLLERRLDRLMARTRARPLVREEVSGGEAIAYIAMTGAAGLAILLLAVNALTMWLTAATFLGYAVIYTLLLKPLTPQNIVIGGASGAMPPVLGWAAATGGVSPEALLLFLIIFVWTPPHFWALALYRSKEYAQAGIPMLPVTHGDALTRRFILLYSVALVAVSLLPYVVGASGPIYAASALALGARFVQHAWRMNRDHRDATAMRAFRFSITYLGLLFAALLADHYIALGTAAQLS
jgi:protoheme IX farnesyltransferase